MLVPPRNVDVDEAQTATKNAYCTVYVIVQHGHWGVVCMSSVDINLHSKSLLCVFNVTHVWDNKLKLMGVFSDIKIRYVNMFLGTWSYLSVKPALMGFT